MEVKGAILLYAFAGLTVTFAGFSALLLSVRQAVGARLSLLDRLLAKTVVSHLFILTAGAILPPLLALYEISDAWIWRISALIFALPMLSLPITYPRRRFKVAGTPAPPAILAIFVVFGSAVLVVMLGYVFGNFEHSAAVYITALVVNFFTLAFAFVVALDVIIQQPMAAPRKSSPR